MMPVPQVWRDLFGTPSRRSSRNAASRRSANRAYRPEDREEAWTPINNKDASKSGAVTANVPTATLAADGGPPPVALERSGFEASVYFE